ncbi:MAG: murein biosynthesis integral membrane protein MurJ [Chthoniobacteraceae bacterium]
MPPSDKPTPTKTATPSGKKSPAPKNSALWVGIGILFSRIAGLIRERVFAHYFGNSMAAGAFKAAIRIPNFLQNLFGEGVLSASFIPVYSRLLAEGENELAGRVAGIVASMLALVVSGIVLLGVLLTPVFVDLVAPGFHGEQRTLTVHLVQIMFPGSGVLVLSAWCLGILNSHRMFFISYVAPVFWNVLMIGTMLVFGGHQDQSTLAITLAWGSVAGAVLQFAVQLPFIFLKKHADGRPVGAEIAFAINIALRPVRDIFSSFGTIVISRGVVQLSAYLDGIIASFLGSIAVSGLSYAQTIYLLPIGLFGMSVAAAELPEMSRSTGTQEEIYAKLRGRLIAGQRTIAYYIIPTVAGFLLLGKFIVAGIIQTGDFGKQDTLYVSYILMGSTVGLLAATWGRLYSSAFYALKDTKTPLRYAIVRVTLTGVLGVLFAFPLRPLLNTALLKTLHLPEPALPGIELGLGAMGLTLSAGIAGWIEFLLLKKAMQSRIGSTSLPAGLTLQIWGAALFSGLWGFAATKFVPATPHWFSLAILLTVFGAIYGTITWLMGIAEAQSLLRKVSKLARIGR